MKTISDVISLLENKKAFFLDYERISESMVKCPIEELADLFAQRETLKEKIDEVNHSILECDSFFSSKVSSISLCELNFSDIEPEFMPIFELGQQIYSVINRICSLDTIITRRLSEERKVILSKIKAVEESRKINTILNSEIAPKETGTLLNIKK